MKIRRLTALTAVSAVLLLGACSGDDGDSASSTTAAVEGEDSGGGGGGSDATAAIGDAGNCEQLIQASTPVFTSLFQQLVDDTKDLSAEELTELGQDTGGSAVFQDWVQEVEADSAAIDDKANDLGCSEDDAQEALCNAVDGVEAGDNQVAQAMIQGMSSTSGCP